MIREGEVTFGHRVALAAILAGAAVLLLAGRSWGLPSEARMGLLVEGEADREGLCAALGPRDEPAPGEPWIAFNVRRRAEEADSRASGRLGGPGDLADPLRKAAARSMLLSSASFEEPLVLAALARMRPAEWDLDPKVYQYGGAFLYATGAALKGADACGVVQLVPNAGHYIRFPGEMGRLYGVGRLLSAVAGLFAVWGAFRLGSRLGGGAAGCLAAFLTATAPLLIAHAHTMRAHLFALPFAVWSVEAMLRVEERARLRDALWAGILAGLAAGSSLLYGALLPALLLSCAGRGEHREGSGAVSRARRILAALSAAAIVLLVTNPYLPFSLGALRIEWGDHGLDFEGRSVHGLSPMNVLRLAGSLLPNAMGPAGFLLAAAGALLLAWRPRHRIAALAALPFALLLCLRRGQTPEDMAQMRYGMLLVPVGAAWGGCLAARLAAERRWVLPAAWAAAGLLQVPLALAYADNFRAASRRDATNLEAGRILREQVPAGAVVAFDALPHPADTPVVDVRRFDLRFAPGALAAAGEADVWVLSEACPEAWRRKVEERFEAWIEVRKPAPLLPTLPFRDRFAQANRDFTIYKRKTGVRDQGSGVRSE